MYKNLKEIRTDLGLSQMDVFKITGVSQSTISRIESNKEKCARLNILETALIRMLDEWAEKMRLNYEKGK